MSHSKSQPNPVANEAIEALRRALPYMERLVKCAQALVDEPEIATERCPCDSCTSESTCQKPCQLLEAHLPGKYQGKGHRENLTESFPETLQGVERTRRTDMFGGFQSCQHIFTARQWEVIYLYYHEAKNQKQIAAELAKKRSAVSDLLRRARARKEQHNKRLRQEQLRFLREPNAE